MIATLLTAETSDYRLLVGDVDPAALDRLQHVADVETVPLDVHEYNLHFTSGDSRWLAGCTNWRKLTSGGKDAPSMQTKWAAPSWLTPPRQPNELESALGARDCR